MMSALLRAAALSCILVGMAPVATAAPDRGPTAQELYEKGLRQMRRGYYTKALESFTRVRNYHRDDPLSVKAQLAVADVYFKKYDFEQARYAYEEFATYHPRHENLDYVTYRIGLSIWRRAPRLAGRDLSANKGAVNVWTGFRTRFPESKYADEAEEKLLKERSRLAHKELYIAKFYARRKAWGAVRRRSEYLLVRYPDTPWADDALWLLGKSLHSWGFVDEAGQVRERLSETDSKLLARLDRQLAREPGSPPDEKKFIRPYRIRGMIPGQ